MVARHRKIFIPREPDDPHREPPQTCATSGKRMYANEAEAKAVTQRRRDFPCRIWRSGQLPAVDVPGEQSHIQCGRVTTGQQVSNTATENSIALRLGSRAPVIAVFT